MDRNYGNCYNDIHRDSMRHETFRLNLQQNIDELKKEKVSIKT